MEIFTKLFICTKHPTLCIPRLQRMCVVYANHYVVTNKLQGRGTLGLPLTSYHTDFIVVLMIHIFSFIIMGNIGPISYSMWMT